MPRFTSLILLVLATVGCSYQTPALVGGGADAGAPAETGPPPSAMADALAAAGLDIAHLPPLDAVDDAQRDVVMRTFTQALGLACSDCHDADYAVATSRTRIARKMWDRLVRGLERRDGGALYCDSCHAGRATFLDRSDARVEGALGSWMRSNYVAPLARRDGAPHDCATCHGTPFVGGFLDAWADDDGDAGDAGAALDGGSDRGAPDLGAAADLGGAPDLGAGSCEALLICLDACPAGDGTCTGVCRRRASAAAKALLAAAEKCANDACIAAKRCRSANDDSPACDTCFSNASAGGVTGVACAPSDDPICGACAPAWYACETS